MSEPRGHGAPAQTTHRAALSPLADASVKKWRRCRADPLCADARTSQSDRTPCTGTARAPHQSSRRHPRQWAPPETKKLLAGVPCRSLRTNNACSASAPSEILTLYISDAGGGKRTTRTCCRSTPPGTPTGPHGEVALGVGYFRRVVSRRCPDRLPRDLFFITLAGSSPAAAKAASHEPKKIRPLRRSEYGETSLAFSGSPASSLRDRLDTWELTG